MTVLTLRATKGSPLSHQEVDDNFRNVSERLTEDRTYFVDPAGSDGFDGLSAEAPFATLQHAIDTVSLLDLDWQYNVTVQLAAGTYDAVDLKDPLGAYTNSCVLLGDEASRETYILSAGVSAIRSVAWRVDGVRLQSDTPGAALALAADYSILYLDNIDFHFSSAFQIGIFCGSHSYVETGPADELTHCEISASGAVTIFAWCLANGYGHINTGSDISCQSTTLAIYPLTAWVIASQHSFIQDYNNYGDSENITGKRFEVTLGSALQFRRLYAFAGDVPGVVDATSWLLPNNSVIGIPGSALPVLLPESQPLVDVPVPDQILRSTLNDKTITNEGAAAIVQYDLPGGVEDLHYIIGNDDAGPLGFRFGFVVADAFGIRISATGGKSISNGGVAFGKIESTTIGSAITLLNTAGLEWVATAQTGTWAGTAQIANSVQPAVSPATQTMGNAVTCSTGTWATSPAIVYYQWYRIDVMASTVTAIHHAIASSFTVDSRYVQVGDGLSCVVSILTADGTGSVSSPTSNICMIV